MREFVRCVTLASWMLVSACGSATETRANPGPEDQSALKSSIPEQSPDIAGTITRVEPAGVRNAGPAPGGGDGTVSCPPTCGSGGSGIDMVLVEEHPGDFRSGGAKASIAVSASTRILERSGVDLRTLTFADLRTGSRAKAWFNGPVMESYPAQGTASVILVERPD